MKIIDLSKPIVHGDNYHCDVEISDYATHAQTAARLTLPAKGYAVKKLIMSDHSATHVDAPLHFIPDGQSIDEPSLDRYCGPAKVIDFSADTGDQGELTLSVFLAKLSNENISLEQGDCVLFKFQEGDKIAYSGLSEHTSAQLVESGVRLVGTDQPSIDWFENKTRPAHRLLLAAGIPVVEMLTNLQSIKNKQAVFMGLPLKITGATGSPIRAAALIF